MTAAATSSPPFVSYADYCCFEAISPERHYYDRGRVLAMAGGSFAHSQICVNLIAELRHRLAGGPCQPIDSNFRVAFPGRTFSHYTDGMIICGPPEIDPEDPTGQSLTNPTAVFEVQSPSTGSFDRSIKFDRYRELASFREYVIVFQDKPEVLTYFRQDDGTWLFRARTGLDGRATLRSVDLTLPLAGVYARVEFPAAPYEEPSPDGR